MNMYGSSQYARESVADEGTLEKLRSASGIKRYGCNYLEDLKVEMSTPRDFEIALK